MGLDLVLLTSDPQPASVLPGLALLPHRLRALRPHLPAVLAAGPGVLPRAATPRGTKLQPGAGGHEPVAH
jgi:hypothetical protein